MCEDNQWLKPLMPMINANFWFRYDFGSKKYSCDCLVLRAVLHLGKQFRRLQFGRFRLVCSFVSEARDRPENRSCLYIWVQGIVTPTFRELSKIISLNTQYRKSHLWREFRAETFYVCPKPCFGHTYKVSAWNSHKNDDLCNTQVSRKYHGELAKR